MTDLRRASFLLFDPISGNRVRLLRCAHLLYQIDYEISLTSTQDAFPLIGGIGRAAPSPNAGQNRSP
ncbi:MAG TPA: hypothetical protein VM657_08345 [Sphingomonas sp.]|nr:hypothetical protein [Sphingomonas sp.]